jgi:hypothetical protein
MAAIGSRDTSGRGQADANESAATPFRGPPAQHRRVVKLHATVFGLPQRILDEYDENSDATVTGVSRGANVTLEPISGQLVIAKAAFQAGTAAIQLSDTVIGRIKLRRMIYDAEKQEIQRWLQASG